MRKLWSRVPYSVKFTAVVIKTAGYLIAVFYWLGCGYQTLVIIVPVAALIITRRFINRCWKCGSWKTKVRVYDIFDRHDSGGVSLGKDTECRECGFVLSAPFL